MRTPIFEACCIAAFLAVVFFYTSYKDSHDDKRNTREYCEAVYSGMIEDSRGTYHELCYMGIVRVRPVHRPSSLP